MATVYKELMQKEQPRITAGKLVFVYILAGLVGTVYETLLNLFRGDGLVACNGSLFTLFNPVYGAGGVAIVFVMGKMRRPISIFCVGAVVGASVEYLLSFLEEAIMGTRSWDYSELPLNIDGRTTVPLAILWGALSVGVICIVYLPYSKLLDKLPRTVFRAAAAFFLVVVVVDSLCTVTVLFRYNNRMRGDAPDTAFEEFLDKHFDDDYMQKMFPQMKPVAKDEPLVSGDKLTRAPRSLSCHSDRSVTALPSCHFDRSIAATHAPLSLTTEARRYACPFATNDRSTPLRMPLCH